MIIPHKKLTLEINSINSNIVIEAHRGDALTRFYDISLTVDGVLLKLTSEMQATVNASINNVIVADGDVAVIDVENNYITIELTEKMLSLSGILIIDLVLVEETAESTEIITAETFRVYVGNSAINENSKFELTGGTIKQKLEKKLDDADGSVKIKNLAQEILDLIGSGGGSSGGGVTLSQVTTLLNGYAKSTDLATKEDSSNKVTSFDPEFSDKTKFPTVRAIIEYLQDYYYDFNDTYSMEEIDKMLSEISDELDYVLTDEDKSEIANAVKTDLTQIEPNFANSIDECTDTSKVYVLPDGYIYAYAKSVKEAYKNQIPISIDTDGTVYNVIGYKDGARLSSSLAESTLSNAFLTGYIPVKIGDVIRFNGNYFKSDATNASSMNNALYDSSFTKISGFAMSAVNTIGAVSDIVTNDEGYITQFTINPNWTYYDNWSDVAYIRLTLIGSGENAIVTVNEEITDTSTESYAWSNTGHAFIPTDYEDRIIAVEETANNQQEDIDSLQTQIEKLKNNTDNALPTYWEEHLSDKIKTIKSLQSAGGKDCFSFVVLADIHRPSNLGKLSPLIAERIMDECSIKYALVVGDTQTRGCWSNKDSLLAEEAEFQSMISPIADRVLRMEGNHDRAYGTFDRDGDGSVSNYDSDGNIKPAQDRETYVYNLTPEEFYEFCYRKVGTVGDVHFDDTGTAYYVDDAANKVRYICLNTHCVPYEESEDGTAEYSSMWVFRFTQSQFDFLTDEALVNLSENWSVVVSAHVPLTQEIGDREIMQEVLKAYKNKTAYSGTYRGEYDFDAVSVDVDFTNAKGNLVGYFAGHTHADSVNTSLGFNVIVTRSDAKEENDATLNAERVAGTVTEQSFDVFTVNKKTRTIHATKIGAGDDREISY